MLNSFSCVFILVLSSAALILVFFYLHEFCLFICANSVFYLHKFCLFICTNSVLYLHKFSLLFAQILFSLALILFLAQILFLFRKFFFYMRSFCFLFEQILFFICTNSVFISQILFFLFVQVLFFICTDSVSCTNSVFISTNSVSCANSVFSQILFYLRKFYFLCAQSMFFLFPHLFFWSVKRPFSLCDTPVVFLTPPITCEWWPPSWMWRHVVYG